MRWTRTGMAGSSKTSKFSDTAEMRPASFLTTKLEERGKSTSTNAMKRQSDRPQTGGDKWVPQFIHERVNVLVGDTGKQFQVSFL